jgi:SAM-dependent methyltransferase
MDLWNEGMYERLTSVLEPVHDELAGRLAPQPGERLLDLGSGTASIARRAARAGADAVGLDSSAPLLDKAREDAEHDGVSVQLDVGNVEYLPYEDAEFDVVASAFGFIFAADHANVAGELARVARPGARLGFTAWKPNPKLGELYRRFTEEPLEGREATEWGREDHVEDMLGEDFELEFVDGTLWMDAGSGEELWEIFSTSSPPVTSLLYKLDADRGEAFHQAFVELYESYREGDRIKAPRRYLLTLGTRR